jgi:hypothetical protein
MPPTCGPAVSPAPSIASARSSASAFVAVFAVLPKHYQRWICPSRQKSLSFGRRHVEKTAASLAVLRCFLYSSKSPGIYRLPRAIIRPSRPRAGRGAWRPSCFCTESTGINHYLALTARFALYLVLLSAISAKRCRSSCHTVSVQITAKMCNCQFGKRPSK